MSSPSTEITRTLPRSRRHRWAQRWLERAIDRLPFVEKEMLLLQRLVEPGWVCVDVGAAGGTYTHLLSRRVGPHGRVHAVEPRAASMRHLRRLRRWLGWSNVTLHQIALADRAGVDRLLVPRLVRTEAHLAAPGHGGSRLRAEPVTTLPLDALVDAEGLQRLDLLLCDVEGGELRLLAGAAAAIERFRPVVACEVEARHHRRYGTRVDDVLRWFHERDYVAHLWSGGELIPVATVSTMDNDHVFWPRERPSPARLRVSSARDGRVRPREGTDRALVP